MVPRLWLLRRWRCLQSVARRTRKDAILHGRNAYKRSLCRCNVCREANRVYERKRVQRSRGVKMPLPYDTMTREEFYRHRGE